MYLLASAFFVASIYSFFVGEVSNASLLVGVALLVGGARFFLGPQEEATVLRKTALGIGVLVLIAAVAYSIRAILG